MAGLSFYPGLDLLARLEIGLQYPLLTRSERVELGLGLRVLYISDIHLRSSNQRRIVSELLDAFKAAAPNFVLLGGDLVDQPSCLEALTGLVGQFAETATVGAVWGNHDTLVGRSRVREAVKRAGGSWLPDGPVHRHGLQVLGDCAHYRPGCPAVLCSHYPTTFPAAQKRGIDLVMAGHLHGWQIVLGHRKEYLYPGALLSRWNGLRFRRGDSVMLVSRGVTDLLPLRWNCPREVILVQL